MTEMTDTFVPSKSLLVKLLATVSASALTGLTFSIAGAQAAQSADNDPSVWIELGGQLEHQERSADLFTPDFVLAPLPDYRIRTFESVQKPPRYSKGFEGKISIKPGEDWIVSVALRYGRSNGTEFDHEDAPGSIPIPGTIFRGSARSVPDGRFVEMHAENRESHAVVDFQVGKDVGLGLFGRDIGTHISAGVRVAQFSSDAEAAIGSTPSLHFLPIIPGRKYFPVPFVRHYTGAASAERSFSGIGPSVSWSGFAPIIGTVKNGGATLDWGVNAAVLFGRQKSTAHYNVTAQSGTPGGALTLYRHASNSNRTRSIAVPNVGGFAGFSLRYPNAKVSLGYRADFFVDAIDGGFGARKSYDREFYGPFATLSIGFGG